MLNQRFRISINSINQALTDDMVFCILIDTLKTNFHIFDKIIILIKFFFTSELLFRRLYFRVGATSRDNFIPIFFFNFHEEFLDSFFLTNKKY